MKTNRIEIIISGIGGQGVVYSANLIGRAALYQHKFSSSIAHYGPESRGSVTTSEVVISNPIPHNQIDYPCVESPDIFIAMHQKGYDYHITNHKTDISHLKYLIYDSTLVNISKTITPAIKKVNLIAIPASQLAKEELKNIMMANIILTAALVKATVIITRNNLERTLKEMTNLKEHRLNLQAIKIGYIGNNFSYQPSSAHF
ncbi:MAG: 2-oxoacid:acceptor oxidoreductase family protein [Planctomycetota bacterium]